MYRVFWRLSGVAILTNDNFSTPKRAKLNLILVENQIVVKDKKVKCFTECNQRPVKKVKNLNKEMVEVMEKQNMLSHTPKVTKLNCIINTTNQL